MNWLRRSLAAGAWAVALVSSQAGAEALLPAAHFQTSDRCVACHNGMSDATGQDFSIGLDWRVSVMGNSAHDPYWRASARREVEEHPEARAAIEDECSVCHLPIPRYESKQRGENGRIFSHFTGALADSKAASDGVTCSVCHQIEPGNLGKEESFDGNFRIAAQLPDAIYPEYGPYDIFTGLQHVMQSSTQGFTPMRGDHIRSSELCATCHTLRTQARDPDGHIVGTLPEQMPYQEWQHSAFRNERSCQSCHMPQVEHPVAIARTLGVERPDPRRHLFLGANFFMQSALARYRDELGPTASSQELSAAADRTKAYLQAESASLRITAASRTPDRLIVDVLVSNLGGHKLPTAFPSRRAWLHVSMKDASGRVLFESGALQPDGSIDGNDNDRDPTLYEPHYREITKSDQVQIYEDILADSRGRVTTGILSALTYAKDNRLLPRGFDKTRVPADIAVYGDALQDDGFTDAGHAIRYAPPITAVTGPVEVLVELLYQPIGFRWASNLQAYRSEETTLFSQIYQSQSTGSATRLAQARQLF